MIAVADIAGLLDRRSRKFEDHIFSLGQEVMKDEDDKTPAAQELSLILDEAYSPANCDQRPMFASFYEDFYDDLSDPTDTLWPNKLRDRLGLYQLNQWEPALPIKVFLFRYAVQELPRLPNQADQRPLAIPVVLDHRLFPAFCPAPNEL